MMIQFLHLAISHVYMKLPVRFDLLHSRDSFIDDASSEGFFSHVTTSSV